MTRRAYGFAVGLALAVGILAWVGSYRLDLPLRDPDGLAGPAYVRLPLIVIIFFLSDVVPRVLIKNRGFKNFVPSFKEYTKLRWTKSRIALVGVGLSSFYVVYVSYRNIKGFLPFVRTDTLYDSTLHKLDIALMFGHDPAVVLHNVLGTGIAAHLLSYIYIMFLTFVPVSLGAALVWSKNVATGFWYVTALCINWVLGALSYYWLPSLGPFYKNGAFNELPETGVTALQRGLAAGRQRVLEDPHSTTSIQSVAAFASLHVSIIFTAALICHYVIQSRWVRWSMWIYFVLTTISTVYFGWHYLLDDIAGLAIGWIAVWIGAKTTGHVMGVQRHQVEEGDGVIGVFPPESGRRQPTSGDGMTDAGQGVADADDAASQKSVHDTASVVSETKDVKAAGKDAPVNDGAKRSLLRRKRTDAPDDDDKPADEKNSARA
jgi:membrane-associated phospholipid phosphatase